MWAAFVYGIAATNPIASRPWNHQSACRVARSPPSPAPMASKPWAATQPAGEYSS
jgi:hypothetical protein